MKRFKKSTPKNVKITLPCGRERCFYEPVSAREREARYKTHSSQKITQNLTKMHQIWSEHLTNAENASLRGPRGSIWPPKEPKENQEGSQTVPKDSQGVSKASPEGPQGTPRVPKGYQKAPKSLPKKRSWPQNGAFQKKYP